MSNAQKAIIHGVGFFLVAGAAGVARFIPESLYTLTVGGAITAGLVYIGTYLENR